MRDGRIEFGEAKRIGVETYEAWVQRGAPKAGDLILAREAPVGQVVRVPADRLIALGQRTVLLRPNPEAIDDRYLHYLMLGPEMQQRMSERAEGSTVPHLNVADVRCLEIPPLPPLPVQASVGELLAALDLRLESDRRTAGLCEQLLVNLAAGAAEAPVVPLAELVIVDRDAVNPTSLAAAVDHFSIPAFDSDRTPDRCPASSIKSNKFAVRSASVLLSRLNPRTPRLWHAVPEQGIPALASTEFLVMRPSSGLTIGDLWLACSDPLFSQVMAHRATGTSGSHQRVRPADALSLEVIDPRSLPAGLRHEASDLLQLAHQRRSEAAVVSTLRDTLLPELLSGRLRVPVAEDLVAEVT